MKDVDPAGIMSLTEYDLAVARGDAIDRAERAERAVVRAAEEWRDRHVDIRLVDAVDELRKARAK